MPDKRFETPAVTSANVPRPPVPPPPTQPRVEAENVNIIAKPLVTPAFTEVRSKNPNLSFRYANRTAGGSTGNEGMQVDQWLSVGFRPATPADCDVMGLAPRNGQFIKGDLILLCIARADYEGALMWNRERATRRANKTDVRQAGLKEINQQIQNAGIRTPPDLSKKLQVFTPSEAVVSGLVGDAGESQ